MYTFAVSYRISTPKSTGEEEHCKGGRAAEGKSTAEGKAAERSSNKWGRAQQRGSAAKWGSAVAARDSKEKRVF